MPVYLKMSKTVWTQNYFIGKELHRNNSYIAQSHYTHLLRYVSSPVAMRDYAHKTQKDSLTPAPQATTVLFHTGLFQRPNFYWKQFKLSLALTQPNRLAIQRKSTVTESEDKSTLPANFTLTLAEGSAKE